MTDKDAYGHMLLDSLNGVGSPEIVEREDGHIAASAGADLYFADFPDWPEIEQRAFDYARGRVLDVGCGGGRVCLHWQADGGEVVGIDNSPLAIEVCKQRGVREAHVLSVGQITRQRLNTFESIIMYGNNLGLMGNMKRGKWLLNRLATLTTPRARILGSTTNPYLTENPIHQQYHEKNRARGRMGGQLRIRVRYQTYKTGWFDYWLMAPDEVSQLVEDTPWRWIETFEHRSGRYVVVLEKTI